MTDDLLSYYERELGYLRQLGAEFATAHPKIAGRLRLGADAVEDPHVARLIESVAFLNARTRAKLDDDFPELVDAFLSVTHPHLLAPTPSMSIVRFEGDPEATAPSQVAAGAQLETDRSHGPTCRFRTAYPVTVWPFRVSAARLVSAPLPVPRSPRSGAAAAAIHLSLRTKTKQDGFQKLAPSQLRFFLRGQPSRVGELYGRLFENLVEVVIAQSSTDPRPIVLGPDALRPVGFGADEGLLPYSGRSSIAHRVLAEFLVFPAKHHFVDLVGIPRERLASYTDSLEIFLLLDSVAPQLEASIDAETFSLGCTPIVNLFKKRAEPIVVTQREVENHVVPDAREPLSNEVYSVDSVTAHSRDGRTLKCLPFYDVRHGSGEDGNAVYYTVRREEAQSHDGKAGDGREAHLGLVDLDGVTHSLDDWVLSVETTCTNRDLPGLLPFGGDQPRLFFSDGGGQVRSIRCLLPPTKTLRPARGRAALWKLVSHLALGQGSFARGADAAASLREALALYAAVLSPENRNVVESVRDVTSRPKAMRVVSGGLPGVARGLEISVRLDEARLNATGRHLFSRVLDHFLGGVASINSFTELVVRGDERNVQERRWKPRAGNRPLA
jgi:type VI secretion system protein ImpG